MRPLASVLFAVALALSFSGCDLREWFVCSLGYLPVGSSFEPGFVDTYPAQNGTSGYYAVRARDDAGNESPPFV